VLIRENAKHNYCIYLMSEFVIKQCKHIQADDREKAKTFVEMYDNAMLSPDTAVQVHRVSTYLAEGTLGNDLRAYAAGEPMTDHLRTEITAYQMCMLDDSIQEGPHARISRVVRASSAAKPPWWSSGVRLQQNLDARASLEALHRNRFVTFFTNWKFLTQRSTRALCTRALTPKRQSTDIFLNKVYRMGQENRIDWSGLKILTTGPGSKASSKSTLSLQHRMIIDYLKRVCKPMTYFSINTQSSIRALDDMPIGGGPRSEPEVTVTPRVFRVVSFNVTRKVQVLTDEVMQEKSYLLAAIVQQYDLRAFDTWPCTTLHVYPDGDPTVVDLAMISDADDIRNTMREWQEGDASTPAVFSGCWDLQHPVRIADKAWSPIYILLVALM
jgi:hypothetical protein